MDGMMAAQESDRDLQDIRRVLAGEAAAYAGIVARWEEPLINLAYRFCRDKGTAEEMAQDAFVKAFKSLDSWRGEAKFSTWLFAVALNVYRSRMRKFAPRFVSLQEITGLAEPARQEADYEADEEATIVRRMVLTLPAKYRDAIIVFYFHEKDITEAASTLGVPEGTLKARLHRARTLLRKKLAATIDVQWQPETT